MGDLEYARGLSQTYLSFSSLNLSKNVHYFNRVWEYRAVEVSKSHPERSVQRTLEGKNEGLHECSFKLLGYSEYFG